MTHQEEISFETSGHREMRDLTSDAAEVVTRSKITTGIVHLFNVGSTGALGTVEFEPGLLEDLPEALDRLFPPGAPYAHEQTWHDGNGHSHLQATVLGPAITVPVSKGRLVLGTWQQIFHLECDVKPRKRTVVVTVIGDQGR